MLVEAVGVLAITAVCGAATGLHVGNAIWRGAEDAKECFGMHGAGADFDIVGLLKYAALIDPEMRKLEDQVLEIEATFGSSFALAFKSSPTWRGCEAFSRCGIRSSPTSPREVPLAFCSGVASILSSDLSWRRVRRVDDRLGATDAFPAAGTSRTEGRAPTARESLACA